MLLRREGEALARLRHPGIATVYEAGTTEDGDPFLAMELVPGEPLDRWLAARDPPRAERVEIIRRIAEAVQHAHEAGVVHRDLKPANVLVDGVGAPRVLDFGLARIAVLEGSLATRASDAGTLVGTLPYMSPEQVRGLPDTVDARTDVYALGVMLYEALLGRRPYDLDAASIPAAVRTICETAPRSPRSIDPSFPRDLETIVLAALEKDPARRYPTARTLAEDLGAFLESRPIAARRAGLARRAALFLVRHRAAAAVALLAVVAAAWISVDRGGVDLNSPLAGSGHAKRAPFDDLRWRGDVPQVAGADGAWLDLEAVDGVRTGLAVEFCKQSAGPFGFRKRFSEDLVEVLTRLGRAPGSVVTLTLREPSSGTRSQRTEPMTETRRNEVWRQRCRVPWTDALIGDDGIRVVRDGSERRVVSIDDVPIERILARVRASVGSSVPLFFGMGLVDALTDERGASPGETVALVLDPGGLETAPLTHANYVAAEKARRAAEKR
jgi:hypothetical protein